MNWTKHEFKIWEMMTPEDSLRYYWGKLTNQSPDFFGTFIKKYLLDTPMYVNNNGTTFLTMNHVDNERLHDVLLSITLDGGILLPMEKTIDGMIHTSTYAIVDLGAPLGLS